jgi:triacylglycerol lipase
MAIFVLAHGIFGFGDPHLINLPFPLNHLTAVVDEFSPHYFNSVSAHLESQGHNVYMPQVNPIGSVRQRAEKLQHDVLAMNPPRKGVHILAHSMGGLDSRYALAHYSAFAECVATLVTIGTPHYGSPVADAVFDPEHPLAPVIPSFVRNTLTAGDPNTGAPRDLTTEAGRGFDALAPKVENVLYANVAGDASKGIHTLYFFRLAAAIGDLTDQINDGVVTRNSALHPEHEHLPDWPVDHAGEVGWQIPLDMASHLARYDALVAYCLG